MKILGFGGTSLFGATQPAAQPTSIFGSTTSTFGTAQPAQPTTMFGSALTGATQVGTTVKFEAFIGQGKTYCLLTAENRFLSCFSLQIQCVQKIIHFKQSIRNCNASVP